MELLLHEILGIPLWTWGAGIVVILTCLFFLDLFD